MNEAKVALLRDRSVVSVTGEDARKLLQGIITNDMDELVEVQLGQQPAIFAGLLSPQGKVLFDFFVVKVADGYLLDVEKDRADELAKRLTMYRLRAKAEIIDKSSECNVWAAWGASNIEEPWDNESVSNEEEIVPMDIGFLDSLVIRDPRCWDLGKRWIVKASLARQLTKLTKASSALEADYHAHRIALGIPEGGKDYDFGDVFPHEANFDLLHGVAFEKGCYVGQEIVSRMQHRATVRKRIVRVTATTDLPGTRSDVKLGEVVIGKLGSVSGMHGLAMLRLDRAIEAIDTGEPITADGIALTVDTEALARHRATMAQKASHI